MVNMRSNIVRNVIGIIVIVGLCGSIGYALNNTFGWTGVLLGLPAGFLIGTGVQYYVQLSRTIRPRERRYRITNPEPGLFASAVKYGWRWISLDDHGRELPWGCRCSGPLGAAVNGVSAHGQISGVKVEPFASGS